MPASFTKKSFARLTALDKGGLCERCERPRGAQRSHFCQSCLEMPLDEFLASETFSPYVEVHHCGAMKATGTPCSNCIELCIDANCVNAGCHAKH